MSIQNQLNEVRAIAQDMQTADATNDNPVDSVVVLAKLVEDLADAVEDLTNAPAEGCSC